MFKKGYTTLELMTTLSMMAVLASLALPSYQAMRSEAGVTKAQAEVKTLQGVVERYQTIYHKMPATLDLRQMPDEVNITNQNVFDPFDAEQPYGLETGQTTEGREYYVVFSKGENQKKDFVVVQNRVYNDGDDVLASNLMVINHK